MDEEQQAVAIPAEITAQVTSSLLSVMDGTLLEHLNSKLSIEITDEESARQALACCLQARKLKNKVESSRKEIVRPHIDFQKAVMKLATDISTAFEMLEADFEKKLTAWMDEQKENPFTRVDDISVEDGSISSKRVTSYTVTDEDVVPREFLAPDDKKIKKAISKGQSSIPGIEIVNVDTYTLRVKN